MLQQLYYGNLYPSENIHPSIDGYAEANQLATQAYEELESKLYPKMKALLEHFISENMHLCYLDETQAFIGGFKVASKLFAEIYLQG
ncbi:DUF6809 family protein [Anaerovorax odorimutans]|uniref:DUF6809 family protein n=1 Tax=Anaerovorax odorimutans TaxID=109327 RepID=UPI0004266FDF|nr:DUF6809 family protein [Anaerovorax odorimutans]